MTKLHHRSGSPGSVSVRCPVCNHGRSRTLDSRFRHGRTMRRRECCACDARFSTIEILAAAELDDEDLNSLDGGLQMAQAQIVRARQTIRKVRDSMIEEVPAK